MVEVKEHGCYWEVDSNNNLVNEDIQKELSSKAQKISDLFLQEIDKLSLKLHSVYIGGSYSTNTATADSDIDFFIITNDIKKDQTTERDFKQNYCEKISKVIKDKLNIDIHVDVNVYHVDSFKSDYPSRFVHKCIKGENLSLSTISFDCIKSKNLDGLENDDLNYLRIVNREVIDFIDKNWETEKNEIDLSIRHYTKLLLRSCFNTICIEKKIWTRSLYYCYYFFTQEFPETENLTRRVLELFLNPRKSKEEVKKILKQSLFLVRHMQDRLEVTKYL